MYDPRINNTQAGTMRAIQMAVAQGHHYFICGEVPVDRAPLLVQRFDERYQLQMTQGQRDHARRAGKATFRLMLWPIYDRTSFYWILLRTDGTHPLLAIEQWLDARGEKRIQWPWRYVLVRTPVPKPLRDKYRRANGHVAINAVTWTWRFQPMEVERIKALVRHIVHTRDGRMQQLIRGLAISPGFRGVRDDVYKLYRYVEKRCAQHHRDEVIVPKSIFPIRAKVGRLVPFSVVMRRARAGKESWFPDVPPASVRPPVEPLKGADTEVVQPVSE